MLSPSPLTAQIEDALRTHRDAVDGFFAEYAPALEALARRLHETLKTGGKLLICGNGGSACDAMHIAGEFSGRFVRERRGLAAIALSADSGVLTAVGNDYGFERVFARQVEALGRSGDMLIALSTSGSSPNVIAALEEAKTLGLYRVLMTGEKGRDKTAHTDALFAVPAYETARIQEAHMLALHLLAGMVDAMVAGEA